MTNWSVDDDYWVYILSEREIKYTFIDLIYLLQGLDVLRYDKIYDDIYEIRIRR